MKNATEKMTARVKKADGNYKDAIAAKLDVPEKATVGKKQKFVIQFIDHESGRRSEPLVGNWSTVKEVLDLRKEGEKPEDKDYILLVAVLDGKDTTIPATPLITVKTFMDFEVN